MYITNLLLHFNSTNQIVHHLRLSLFTSFFSYLFDMLDLFPNDDINIITYSTCHPGALLINRKIISFTCDAISDSFP